MLCLTDGGSPSERPREPIQGIGEKWGSKIFLFFFAKSLRFVWVCLRMASSSSSSLGALKSQIFDKEERKQQYQAHIRGLNAYDRHKKFLNDYVHFYGGEKSHKGNARIRTDHDTLREGYRFIRSEEDDWDSSWEQRLVKRYYDKLFKEYCIADMTKYKTGKIGLRWRTEIEVISGKGQLICGNKHCDDTSGLASYEVNFSYFESGENKQALVKLVTCKRCAEKLNYKKLKDKEVLEEKEKDKSEKQWKSDSKRKRDHESEYMDRKKESKIKGDEQSMSGSKHMGKDDDDNENFNEFLEGMFP
ncbi:hypothetical protein MLD38_038254 [Melastoma candidum]|uniref:Uncharacterized protein n=1 Tax=Melastoma candidum TaxID=119954 RepID=A0ACB9KYZ5_9MYRT|nr:hypothetical protein MLD38_038254 [Melastoma candidum]